MYFLVIGLHNINVKVPGVIKMMFVFFPSVEKVTAKLIYMQSLLKDI